MVALDPSKQPEHDRQRLFMSGMLQKARWQLDDFFCEDAHAHGERQTAVEVPSLLCVTIDRQAAAVTEIRQPNAPMRRLDLAVAKALEAPLFDLDVVTP